jgi:uncharacterized protein
MQTIVQLIRASDQSILLLQLELATTFWSRFKGLQLRRKLPDDSGLLLRPCSSLHTCFMRFAIDVIMLDGSDVVLAVRRELRPWRMLICAKGTHAVIETAVDACAVKPGDKLLITARSRHAPS